MNIDLNKAREIFIEAVGEVPAEQWEAFLSSRCGVDAELRRHVHHLLQAHVQAGSFLDRPAVQPVDTGAYRPGPGERPASQNQTECRHGPGAVIGHYKLLQQIGEGGMGAVFMAEQTQPVRRTVALKIIKPGMDSRQVLARFEAERQALALMDHPNIAKVLDAGTTDNGRPFFVMELVKGVPITRYCDEHRFTPKQRLELFIPVCQAVQHAHQKGVIHRDLKPSNVLLAEYDDRPVAKVIDFGVAKATGPKLTERTMFTEFGQVVGTLEYMSPEQAELNALDIDTRSDIYALGVLLYELLTGTTPFEKKQLNTAAFDEVLRIIREEEPPRPSTRLSTTEELPSIAANRGLEPRKLSGLVRGELDWIVMKALEKDRSRRYETANGLAMDVQRYLADEPVLACPPSLGYRLRKLLRRHKTGAAVAGLVMCFVVLLGGGLGWVARDRSARQATLEAKVGEAIQQAEAFVKREKAADALAQVQHAERLLGRAGPEALRAKIRQARADAEMLWELDAIRLRQAESKEGNMFNLAGADAQYATAFRDYGIDAAVMEPAEGAARVRSSAIREALLAGLDAWMQVKPAADPERARLRAVADGADDSAWRRAFREAALTNDPQKLKAVAEREEALGQPPAVLAWLGSVLDDAGLPREAAALLRQAQQRHPADFWINYNLGHVLLFRPRLHTSEEAVGYFRVAVAIRPGSAEAQSILGLALLWKGDVNTAVTFYRRATALDPKFAVVHANLARALLFKGDLDGAVASFRGVVRLLPDNAGAHSELGDALLRQGKDAEAEAEWREAIRLHPDDDNAHRNLRAPLGRQGKRAGAEAASREGPRFQPEHFRLHRAVGWELSKQGKVHEAEIEFREAIRLMPSGAGAGVAAEASPREQADCHWGLGTVLKQQGKWAEAVAAYREAIHLDPNHLPPRRDLAVLLMNCPEVKLRDPPRAVEAARKLVEFAEKSAFAWQVLGWAHYRAGDWKASIAALEKSCALQDDPKGGDCGQWFVLAMAHWQLGNKESARQWYDRAAAQIARSDTPWEDVWQSYGEATALIDIPSLGRGRWYAERGDWARAASAFAGAFERESPDDGFAWFEHAYLLLQLGDAQGYRRLCGRMRERFGESRELFQFASLAHACVLAPGALGDPEAVLRLAERRLPMTPLQSPHHAWSVHVLGLAYYRAGQPEKAIQYLSETLKKGPPWDHDMLNSLVLSMAHHRLGQGDEARRCFKRAAEAIAEAARTRPGQSSLFAPPGWAWWDWLGVQILRREAEESVGKKH
jgi:serine/threonine protein kinase/tetratricopeptide (TPR) repeat protein